MTALGHINERWVAVSWCAVVAVAVASGLASTTWRQATRRGRVHKFEYGSEF